MLKQFSLELAQGFRSIGPIDQRAQVRNAQFNINKAVQEFLKFLFNNIVRLFVSWIGAGEIRVAGFKLQIDNVCKQVAGASFLLDGFMLQLVETCADDLPDIHILNFIKKTLHTSPVIN